MRSPRNWLAMVIAAFLLSVVSAGIQFRLFVFLHRRPSALEEWASILLAAAAIGVGLAAQLWAQSRPSPELPLRLRLASWYCTLLTLSPLLVTWYLLEHPGRWG